MNRQPSKDAAASTVAAWIVGGVAALAVVGFVLRLILGGLDSAEDTEPPQTIARVDPEAAPVPVPLNPLENLAQGSYAQAENVRLEGFQFPGNAVPPDQRDRCSSSARNGMATLIREIREGVVVIDESSWNLQATSARVGIAGWLSQCTQEGRSIEIRGDESGDTLARYDRLTGYKAVAKER